jgi:hypothetical protein
MLKDTQIITTLKRDIPTNELVGRKFFRDLATWFPDIRLDSQLSHEEQYWGEYTIVLPHPVNTLFLSTEAIQVSSNSTELRNTMSLKFKDQDPNNTTLPLDSRTLLQNIISQLREKENVTK